MNWTKEQARAIEARGGNLLLSAAAGSGKTTVLVERVLRLILEDGAQIDRMLVVTFTRAAAADMRAKLSEKLMEKAAQGDQRCREQLLLLERALITTLHAFCADFLRTHFEAAGVDPAFRIMDDAQRQHLMDRALDEVMEEAYEAGGEALMALDYGRGPKEVRALTEAMCRVLEERPDPSAWLSRMTGGGSAQMGLWMEELVISARRTMAEARILLTQALAVPGCPAHYAVPIERDLEQLEQLERLAETEQYDSLRQALEEFKPARVGGGKRSDVDEAALETVKKLRERARDALKSVKLLEHPSAQAVRDMEIVAGQIDTLGKLAESVAARLEEKKDEQSGLTYADLERRTLLALQDDDTAEELRRRFDHVFIDEYQDTSDIQEAIVSRLCREDNRFMVGDVKQSIYRFRMAEPGLFIEKYRRYREGEGGTLLPLTRNFRSCKAVLDFVNMVFERVMTGGDAEVVYDELARLNPGRDDSTPGVPVQIHLLEQASAEETDEAIAEMKNAEREGLLIARRIRQLMAEDAGLRYRDFAILTRAKASAFTPMLPMLLAENIPAYADGGTGYYESMEVLLALSMLKLMANGRSDVELIGVLHSPVAGLNADALAQIRIAFRDMPYVDAARRYAQEKGDALARRLQEFFRKLDLWRLQTGVVSLGMLVRSVLEESGLYVYVGALPGGAQRQANLDRLAMEAERFDREVSGSVVRFLEHTRRIREKGDGDAAHLLGENDDVVRMMTVHRSKGLEFRVVFGALLGKRYGGAHREALDAHRTLGLGISCLDPALRTRRRTIAQTAIGERRKREDAAEEMRILYVMLTRARERLELTGSVRNAEQAERGWEALGCAPFAAGSHLDLIMAARSAARQQGAPVYSRVTVHSISGLSATVGTTVDPRAQFDEITDHPERYADAGMEAELAWRYPDELGAQKPLKLTVSGLLRELEGPSELPVLVERPAFLSEESARRMTGAERGTAYHRAMQLLDLNALKTLEGRALVDAVRAQLDEFARKRIMEDAQREAVRPSVLAKFLSGAVGLRLRRAREVHREWPFNVMLRAGEALDTEEAGRFAGEELLVQGTVDCCFIEDGQWVLLDYKTDRSDDPEALREHYRKQLKVYGLALQRITGIPVKERLLCLLGADQVLEV